MKCVLEAPVLRAWSPVSDTIVWKSGDVRNWLLVGGNRPLGRGVEFRVDSCPGPGLSFASRLP